MKYLFTLSTGKCGTSYLATMLKANIPQATTMHEYHSLDEIGYGRPDIKTMIAYNTKGNIDEVQDYWQQKWQTISTGTAPLYAETSHILMNVGLVENAAQLIQPEDEVHFVTLTRNIYDILVSLHNKKDLITGLNSLFWYLHPHYTKLFISPEKYSNFSLFGRRLWYIHEICTRAAYYQLKYANIPQFHFHTITLDELNDREFVASFLEKIGHGVAVDRVFIPERQNIGTTKEELFESDIKEMKEMITQMPVDYQLVAKEFLAQHESMF